MMIDSVFGHSFLHKMPVGAKFLLLLLLGVFSTLTSHLAMLIGLLLALIIVFIAAKLPLKRVLAQSKILLVLLVCLWLFQSLQISLNMANIVVLRILVMVMGAYIITLSTPVSAMLEFFERVFRILRPLGFNARKISLVLTLTIRFIPVFSRIISEVSEAQRARGLGGNIIAQIIPVVIRIIKMHDEISQAVDARGYDV